MSSRVYEAFYLVTVPQGRQGVIPYQYPSAASNPELSARLPKVKDIIGFCFPDLDEIRKSRSVDFKAPPVAQNSGIPSLPISVGSLPLGGGSSTAPSPTPQQAAGASAGKPNFKPEFYTFAISEADGSRLIGVVFRSLPNYRDPATGQCMRYDVGKRFPECLCILTRHQNSVPMFQQVLQLLHSMKLMVAPIDKIEWLLEGIHNRPLPSPGETLSLRYPVSKGVSRTYNFVWPGEGDAPPCDALASVYLFQQLKPKAFVTLLTAMLCERRICFIASEMEKLLACVHAAAGLLYPFSWQHAFIPVLPAGLSSYACGSAPIIFGICRLQLKMLKGLPLADLIYVDLDAGELSWGPDATPVSDIYILPNTSQMVQAAQKLGAEAAKAAEKLDKAFTKGVALLQKYTGQQLVKESDEPKPDAANVLAWDLSLLATSRSNNTITWTAKSKPSRTDKTLLNDEQQLRDSLLAFFVNLVGDASTYLRPERGGKLTLDRDFYLGSRGMLGDSPALSAFLVELVNSACFERLAESRRLQLQGGDRAMSPRSVEGAGPFVRCLEMLKQRAEPFTVSNIKKALKATAQQQQQQQLQQQQQGGGEAEAAQQGAATSGRWTAFHEGALQLTSNYAVTSDAQRLLVAVMEDSYSSVLLPSILRVVWSRLGDSKGLKWRHASKALTLLRELLIRGPESVLSEVLANVNALRAFLEYRSGMGLGQGNKVRDVAQEVFSLVLDVRRYMLLRSVYWAGKKKLAGPRVRLAFEHCLATTFGDIHRVMTPQDPSPAQQRSTSDAQVDANNAAEEPLGPELLGDVSAFTSELGEAEEAEAEAAAEQRQGGRGLARTDSTGSSPVRPPGRWEGFSSSEGPGSGKWETFSSSGGVTPQAQAQRWEAFGSAGNSSATASASGAVSPPLIQLSTTPPPPPPMDLPTAALPPLQPVKPEVAFGSPHGHGYPAAPQPQQPYGAVPAYGAPMPMGMPVPRGYPQQQQQQQQQQRAYGAPYSAAYDPFAGLENGEGSS